MMTDHARGRSKGWTGDAVREAVPEAGSAAARPSSRRRSVARMDTPPSAFAQHTKISGAAHALFTAARASGGSAYVTEACATSAPPSALEM